MRKKLIIIGVILAVLVISVVAVLVFLPVLSGAEINSDSAYVTKISDIYGQNNAFSGNRYSGVVEMGNVVDVKADSDKLIKETFVKSGDTVKKGDKLFEYDIDQMELQLSQAQLDLDQAKSEITLYNNQISALEREKSGADSNELLNIENQILAVQLDLKRAQYTEKNKQDEINKLNTSIENNVVKAEVDGKVTNVASFDTEEAFVSNAYITIATNDEYKVKSNISEENIGGFYEGASILVRSRLDESKTWTGVVESLDVSSPSTNISSDSMISSGNDDTSDSKYPVYVKLDNAEGLMVGQHITIEIAKATDEESMSDSSLKLDEYYICDITAKPYVWCMGADQKLEKRYVELGEYDEAGMKYVVASGLTQDDYIAFPEEHLVEGMPTFQLSMDTAITEDSEAVEGM